MYLAPDEPLHDGASKVAPTPGEYTVTLHGNEYTTAAPTVDGDRVSLSADELAREIESDPNWHGENIRLMSCNTGRAPADGSDAYGQQLADRLGTPVEAPDQYVWVSPDGQYWVGGGTEVRDRMTGDITLRPNDQGGQFVRFMPRERD
jgi:hypothetical protein